LLRESPRRSPREQNPRKKEPPRNGNRDRSRSFERISSPQPWSAWHLNKQGGEYGKRYCRAAILGRHGDEDSPPYKLQPATTAFIQTQCAQHASAFRRAIPATGLLPGPAKAN